MEGEVKNPDKMEFLAAIFTETLSHRDHREQQGAIISYPNILKQINAETQRRRGAEEAAGGFAKESLLIVKVRSPLLLPLRLCVSAFIFSRLLSTSVLRPLFASV